MIENIDVTASKLSFDIMCVIMEGSTNTLDDKELLRQRIRHTIKQELETACKPLGGTETAC